MKTHPLTAIGIASILALLVLGGCPGTDGENAGFNPFGGWTVDDNNNDDTTTDDPADDTNNDNDTASAIRISGTVTGPASAKFSPRAQEQSDPVRVVVVNAQSGATYSATTETDGTFEVDLPADEDGESCVVTLLGNDGKPLGPVIFGQGTDGGQTGLHLDGDVEIGDINVPDNLADGPIAPAPDGGFDPGSIDGDVTARVDGNGVPVGIATFGRGQDAQGTASDDPKHQADADQDGLVDLFDGDDDGDGTVDDFDADADLTPGLPAGLDLNFFMNLKISDTDAVAFFTGDTTGIENALKTMTVITFEVRGNAGLGKNITTAKIIAPPAPAPAYLPKMTVSFGGGGGSLWSASSYTISPDTDPNHFQEWVVPNDFMNTGDTFTVEITYDDGTVDVYPRMINYVFKSIPKLEQVGAPGALATYTAPGTITFDGTKDLVLEWAPPVDDFGLLMVGIPYSFELFFYDTSDKQIEDIDAAATWPSGVTGWRLDGPVLEVPGSTLTTLSGSNTFTVTLAKEVFVDTVQTGSGPVTVGSYKVDIAAQQNGNNAAFMLPLEKS
jgi:hypothetical protein